MPCTVPGRFAGANTPVRSTALLAAAGRAQAPRAKDNICQPAENRQPGLCVKFFLVSSLRPLASLLVGNIPTKGALTD